MKLGIEVLLEDKARLAKLKGKRLGLVAHPASVDRHLRHSLDLLAAHPDLKITAAFGPQHGIRGDKQYNMIESDDFVDKRWKIPVHSLYGEHRRPTETMLKDCDVLIYDLQDIGCRIYTYLATLVYVLDEAEKHGKEVWILDRPNPVGRPVEGFPLEKNLLSFVGSWPAMVMRHGLTSGELAGLYLKQFKKNVSLEVVPMQDYDPASGGGWPVKELAWVNPSPNLPTLASVRVFNGTVLFEGTNLCEGRGTTRPLEMIGAPGFPSYEVMNEMIRFAPEICAPVALRPCFFEPTFYKFKGELCEGIHVHADHEGYAANKFQPLRLALVMLKAIKKVAPGLMNWREPGYEYDFKNLPVDLLNGTTKLREWVDDKSSTLGDLESVLQPGEKAWREITKPCLIYFK